MNTSEYAKACRKIHTIAAYKEAADRVVEAEQALSEAVRKFGMECDSERRKIEQEIGISRGITILSERGSGRRGVLKSIDSFHRATVRLLGKARDAIFHEWMTD